MRIALLGGTGDIGQGLALRFARDTGHEIIIGSRDSDKARETADRYTAELAARGVNTNITGYGNEDAADQADIIVLSVPPYHVGDTVESIETVLSSETVLVTPAVGMQGDEDGLHYHPPGTGSVTELVADRAPDDVSVVGAYHNLAADALSDLDTKLELDTLLVADDADAKATISTLTEEVDGLRPLDAGPLANAAEVESVTPLVINIAKYNDDLHDVGVTFH